MGKLAEMIYNDLIGRRGSSHDTAKHWKTWTERFEQVCGIKNKYDRSDVVKFLAWERQQGFSQNSINTHLRPIRLLAQIQDWPFPKLSMRPVKDWDITRTTFSKEQVVSLIQMGRQLLAPREVSYLALSTTYGLRREEMSKPKPPDIADGSITIHVVKGGPETTHLIPPEIVPYLDSFSPYGKDHMSHLFLKILYKTGVRVGAGYGWHSIRRALTTELVLAEASVINMMRFMRWSEGSIGKELGTRGAMLRVYAQKDQERIDTEIFKIHPFLGYWGTGEVKPIERVSKLQPLIDLIESGELDELEIEQLINLAKARKGE